MKRNKRQRNYKTTTSTELDYMRVIKISVGVLIVFALVLIGSKIAMGEIKFNKGDKEEEVTTIDYQEIIAGEVFNRNSDEYYVLLFNFSDNNASYYTSLINNYKYKVSGTPFFTVDLEKKMNSEFAIAEDDDNNYPYPKDISSLKVKNPTLLKIVNGKTDKVITGKDDITEFFNN